LVQDAAYGTLLREPRRALHARIAETLENQFAEIAERQPELLARHCTEAGLIDKAAGLWAKAGQRSLEHSALVEAVEQLTRALNQISTLSSTPALRREQIKLQVALIAPLHHVKGYAASETKTAVERARLLIEQAEALGEPPEGPLLLFLILFGFWVANLAAFNGDVCRDLAFHFLELAKKQQASFPLGLGHNMLGVSLFYTGDIAESRSHFDQAIAHYDPAKDRLLTLRIGGHDARMNALIFRSWAFWILGFPKTALTDADDGLRYARELDHVGTLMFALSFGSLTYSLCGDFATSGTLTEQLVALAEEKGALQWKAGGTANRGRQFALTGKPSEAVETLTAAIAAFKSAGTTLATGRALTHLAYAYAELGQFESAWRSIGEAISAFETTKERWCEAEANRIAGEVALLSPSSDKAKAEAYFSRALSVARQQQAKSWELRAAMSLARLWRSQGKPQQARELLAPVYGWFTEGFDTLDLKEAKALLEELAA
jgi:predicted ATPase